MTIDPTREEWLEARQRVSIAVHANSPTPTVVIAALGPCPPEPPPPGWRSRTYPRLAVEALLANGVWVGYGTWSRTQLTPDEADAMAKALVEHAAYAREQGAADDGPICGGLRRRDLGEPLCLRPKGHDGVCAP